MADEPIKKEDEIKDSEPLVVAPEVPVEDKAVTNATPVDFSQAGGLNPEDTKDPDRPEPDPQTDLSTEAEEISEAVIDGPKPQEQKTEPANAEKTPVAATEDLAVEQKPEFPKQETAPIVEKPERAQSAVDFGIAPTPPVPSSVLSEQTNTSTSPITPVEAPAPSSPTANLSVEEPNGPFPDELKHWNWGAFFWSWIWGIANNTWISLLALLGPLSLVMMIVLGVKGNEWAWRNRKFNGLDDFKKIQSAWAKWGIVAIIIYLGIVIGATVLFANSISQSTKSTSSSGSGAIELYDTDNTSDGFQDLSDY